MGITTSTADDALLLGALSSSLAVVHNLIPEAFTKKKVQATSPVTRTSTHGGGRRCDNSLTLSSRNAIIGFSSSSAARKRSVSLCRFRTSLSPFLWRLKRAPVKTPSPQPKRNFTRRMVSSRGDWLQTPLRHASNPCGSFSLCASAKCCVPGPH